MAFVLSSKTRTKPRIPLKPLLRKSLGFLQRKPALQINEPGDAHEQQADRMASQATTSVHSIGAAPMSVQRSSAQTGGHVGSAPASVLRALASPGNPLEPGLRHGMESRFGYDFSGVRVHSGALAEQSAQDVSADAYTVGHDIVFGK